jgi:hypothetical protein
LHSRSPFDAELFDCDKSLSSIKVEMVLRDHGTGRLGPTKPPHACGWVHSRQYRHCKSKEEMSMSRMTWRNPGDIRGESHQVVKQRVVEIGIVDGIVIYVGTLLGLLVLRPRVLGLFSRSRATGTDPVKARDTPPQGLAVAVERTLSMMMYCLYTRKWENVKTIRVCPTTGDV